MVIALNRSDRRYFNSDHAASPQLYRGNLSHYHWPDRPVQPVRTVLGITATLRCPYPPNAPHSERFRSPKRTNSSKNLATVVIIRLSMPRLYIDSSLPARLTSLPPESRLLPPWRLGISRRSWLGS